MSLELAEHFYAVARHLESESKKSADLAAWMNRAADAMCEEHMRLNPVPPVHEKGEISSHE